jgi:hypothetical protein
VPLISKNGLPLGKNKQHQRGDEYRQLYIFLVLSYFEYRSKKSLTKTKTYILDTTKKREKRKEELFERFFKIHWQLNWLCLSLERFHLDHRTLLPFQYHRYIHVQPRKKKTGN